MIEYKGGCLCGETTFIAKGKLINPHLCSCSMCQKSSGAPTVAWVEFSQDSFEWTGKHKPRLYPSSENAKRFSCEQCGGLLGAINKDYPNIFITISTLDNPNIVVPGEQHSFKESAPVWWHVHVSASQ